MKRGRSRKPLKEIAFVDEDKLSKRLKHNRTIKRRFDRIGRLYQKLQSILNISPSHSHVQVLELSATELKARGQLIDSMKKRESLANEKSVLLQTLLQAKDQEITRLQQENARLLQAVQSPH